MISFIIPYPKEKSKFCKQYGLNSIYAGKHWTKRKADKDYWRLLVKSELTKQKINKNIFKNPVIITFYWRDGLDIDNHAYMTKLIIDSLKGHLLVDDDKRYVIGIIHKFHTDNNILVEIEEI